MKKSHASAWASDAPTPAQIKEFFDQITRKRGSRGRRITKDSLQVFLCGDLAGSKPINQVDESHIQNELSRWVTLYREVFNVELNPDEIRIPNPRLGFTRLIVSGVLTNNEIYSGMESLFKCWRYTDNLNIITPHSSRETSDIYAIWVRDRKEADEELKNRSAERLERDGISCIRLDERMLLEIDEFRETGKHLDTENTTLCNGSRDSYGRVPSVYWYPIDRKVYVSWWYPSDAHDYFRSRQVVP